MRRVCAHAPVLRTSLDGVEPPRSNFARLAGKRAFRLGFAALSAPRAPSACGGAQIGKSFHLRQKRKKRNTQMGIPYFWLITLILIQKSTKNIFFNFRQNRLFNVDNFFEKSLDRKRGIKRYFQPLFRENICFQSIGFFARRQTNSCAIRKQSICKGFIFQFPNDSSICLININRAIS